MSHRVTDRLSSTKQLALRRLNWRSSALTKLYGDKYSAKCPWDGPIRLCSNGRPCLAHEKGDMSVVFHVRKQFDVLKEEDTIVWKPTIQHVVPKLPMLSLAG